MSTESKEPNSPAFLPADILLPQNCNLTKWAVIACDQYTSQPEYWQRVENYVGESPSTLRMILPESCLDGPNVETDILSINETMGRYLHEERFRTLSDCFIYVERQFKRGVTRRGLIGMIDLEQYDYEPGSDAKVRASENTVLSRIPPRVAVRKNAPLELPHILLLIDDPDMTVISPLAQEKKEMEQVYDFALMENGGDLCGWKVSGAQAERVQQALAALADPAAFQSRYGVTDKPVLQFVVGDGNHSLATAKECYERQKRTTPEDQWADLPSRYALVEVTNLHDESLEFEPIHRLISGVVDPETMLSALLYYFKGAAKGGSKGHILRYVHLGGSASIAVPEPTAQLEVGTLQEFLEYYTTTHGGKIDYIHGEDTLRELIQQPGTVGFILPTISKDQLFQTVIHDGVLPCKTFSMGTADEKRFYLEARKIR
ncbi:MAG: DUF1015 domain-containing protein [Oscillospiraceae bacterium]|nr:DUF1015 domain-containing protein [Oscillospiraceae bacterium]